MSTKKQDLGGAGNRRRSVSLLVLVSLLLASGTAFAQTGPRPSPIDALPTPSFGLELATELSWQALPPRPAREPLRVSPAQAFNKELREEAIDYRFTNRWAYADEALRGDRPVREGRAHAAESMLGDAAWAGLEVVVRDALNKPRRKRSSEPIQGVKHQLRVDSSPSWRLRANAGLTRVRIDLPLSAHDDVSLRCKRRVDRDRCRRELGASVHLNPWDETIRFGFELDF